MDLVYEEVVSVMNAMERLEERRWVEGPKGEFLVALEINDEWSVSKVVEHHPSLKSKQLVASYQTREQAMAHAKRLSGRNDREFPTPDRRGLVAHTKDML
jgi:hypothetical protein